MPRMTSFFSTVSTAILILDGVKRKKKDMQEHEIVNMELAARERSRSTLDLFQISARVIWGLLWWFWTLWRTRVPALRETLTQPWILRIWVIYLSSDMGKGMCFSLCGECIWLACSRLRLITVGAKGHFSFGFLLDSQSQIAMTFVLIMDIR